MKFKKSILQKDDDRCFFCGSPFFIETHHIFGAGLRGMATQNGFVVSLCHMCHNEPPDGVHFNKARKRYLQELCERKFLETHTCEEWKSLVGRNYLELNEKIDK